MDTIDELDLVKTKLVEDNSKKSDNKGKLDKQHYEKLHIQNWEVE